MHPLPMHLAMLLFVFYLVRNPGMRKSSYRVPKCKEPRRKPGSVIPSISA